MNLHPKETVFSPHTRAVVLEYIKQGLKPIAIYDELCKSGTTHSLRQIQDLITWVRRKHGIATPRTNWRSRQKIARVRPKPEKKRQVFDAKSHYASRHYQGTFEL